MQSRTNSHECHFIASKCYFFNILHFFLFLLLHFPPHVSAGALVHFEWGDQSVWNAEWMYIDPCTHPSTGPSVAAIYPCSYSAINPSIHPSTRLFFFPFIQPLMQSSSPSSMHGKLEVNLGPLHLWKGDYILHLVHFLFTRSDSSSMLYASPWQLISSTRLSMTPLLLPANCLRMSLQTLTLPSASFQP